MTTLLHNIDDVRAEIIRLENAEMFEQAAWDRVQRALIEQDRPAALADAQRRMATARGNAKWIVGVDWAGLEATHVVFDELVEPARRNGKSGITATVCAVAMETEPAYASA